MYEREVRGALLEILRASLNEAADFTLALEKIKPNILPSVFRLAKRQDLAHIVAAFVLDNGIDVEDSFKEQLRKERFASIYRCEQMRHALAEISATLEAEGVDYIPLKGAVLRSYYPYESMRTSCDIDVLIRKSDLKRAVNALKVRGYTQTGSFFHDVWLYSPGGVHLELHFSICENMEKLDAVLNNAWQYASHTEKRRYEFSKEFFVYSTYAHMSYHFLGGGCGMRSLADIWIMEHKMGAHYSEARGLLEKAGIYKFASEMSALANKCFGDGDHEPLSDPLFDFIASGGTYGSVESNMAVQKTRSKSPFVYLIRRLFLPYPDMCIAHPILKKLPFLLPFFWLVRWFKALFFGNKKRFVKELSAANNTSEKSIEAANALRSRLEI